MARLVFPSRLALKRRAGSFRAAPVAKVIFTTFLYVSPVQISPSCDHTGTPLHFHSSTTSGSASFTRVRSRPSIVPRQSPSSLILASISREGDWLSCDPLFFMQAILPGPRGRPRRPCERESAGLAYGVGNLKLPCSILGHDGAGSRAPEPHPDEPGLPR